MNSKPNEVKELGRLALKMNRFVEENGDSTVRKGESTGRMEENVSKFSGYSVKRNF